MQEEQSLKGEITMFIIGLVLIVGAILVWGSFTIISPQQKGVVVRLGSIERTMDSGLNFKLPLIEKVVKIDVSTNSIKGTELAYSKDAQTVSFEATVNFAVNHGQVEGVYREFKKDYESRVVVPAIKEAIKSVASKYTAQGIIDNRPKLSIEMKDALVAIIGTRGFDISSVAITNIDFDDAYEESVKEKQVAEQKALQQVNVTKQEEEKKKQEILKAEALAEKTKLEAIALQSAQGEKLIDKLYAEAALEAAKKWDGKLPTQMIPGQTLPFIQLGQ